MLRIRHGQIAALAAARLSEFQGKALAHVRACFPGACAALTEDDLKAHVARGIARGQHHGLDDQVDLLCFLNVVFSLGADFEDRYDWAPRILEDHRFAPRTRVELLAQQALAEIERPRHRAEVELVLPEPEEEMVEQDGLPLDDEGAAVSPTFEEGNFEPMATIWGPGVVEDGDEGAGATGAAGPQGEG
jgi:hypothetical protein